MNMSGTRTNRTSLVFGGLLIGLGVLFLIGQIFRVNVWEYAWPMFILVPGLIFFGITVSGGSSSAGFAIPASIITTVGLIFFFQALTGHYASWAYAWTLIFPTAVGLGLFIMGSQSDDESLRRQGKGFLRAGLVLFVLLGFVFEAIFRMGDSFLSRLFWPSLIILFGVYLILRQTGLFRSMTTRPKTEDETEVDLEGVPSVHGEAEAEAESE
jgi:hypothetical protein